MWSIHFFRPICVGAQRVILYPRQPRYWNVIGYPFLLLSERTTTVGTDTAFERVLFARAVCARIVVVMSSAAEATRNSNGIGCKTNAIKTCLFPNRRPFVTHSAVHLVLICFSLLLDHENRMVEQEHLKLFLVTSTTTSIERALINELSMFGRQLQILILRQLPTPIDVSASQSAPTAYSPGRKTNCRSS
jgi:hypothetical protein